ncbi:unnamed protein product [Pocillopora meandrina]|uniref:Uncharacterized protein n=1 Tax=Pocillopora meandrina TaxID=46732 RepID=A0AAU9XPT0_9CNID|nr:unnamed protein product [Pocillopora meandrina]
MRYENEAGLTELALRHLSLSLLSKRRIHIKAGQMNLSSANNYHLRIADNKLAVPWSKT